MSQKSAKEIGEIIAQVREAYPDAVVRPYHSHFAIYIVEGKTTYTIGHGSLPSDAWIKAHESITAKNDNDGKE